MTIGNKKIRLFAGAGFSCWDADRKQIIPTPTIVLIKEVWNDYEVDYTLNFTWILWGVFVGVKVREV